MPLKIAIIGAGPAGCALARLLSQSNKDIQFTVFESEASLDFRSQGGTLDLHAGAGLRAIKAAGLWDEFSRFARYDGEALRITDKNYLTYLKLDGGKESHGDLSRPEIDRPALRRLLFESLPKDSVTWAKRLKEIDSSNVLHFQDGTSASGFDLIVGADGAFSHTRSRISDVVPHYSGMGGFSVTIPNAERNHKELYDRLRRGSLFSFSDGMSIMPQQMGDGSINVGVWGVRPENWQKTATYDIYDNKAVAAHLKDAFHDWDPRLVEYTQQPDAKVWPRDLFMLPIGNTWTHAQGVTLIGDAAHLATPFAGRGVNEALVDSLKLAEAIIAAADAHDPKVALDKSVVAFEQDMFTRGEKTQTITENNRQSMFLHRDAPRATIESFILNSLSDELPTLVYFLTPLVYAYYFAFKLWYPAGSVGK